MLTQKRIKELLNYDPNTGFFIWRVSSTYRAKKGDLVGNMDDMGYVRTSIDGKKYRLHRLAFLYMNGFFPEHQVDHKNRVKNDNRWVNLRHVTRSCNLQNQKINNKNTSGFTGVSKCRNKWRAYIKISGKRINLGFYKDKLDAALARITFEDCDSRWHCNENNENRKNVMKALRTGIY